uniref:Uncharacterized protein n=1 Tax=Globodera pallida TaxID=36090 RepID=A0A183C187_GLOPA
MPCRPLKLPRSILKLQPLAPKIVQSMETLPMATASPPTAEEANFVQFNDQKRLKSESAQSKRWPNDEEVQTKLLTKDHH